ncbi:MAG TPA: Maf family protein, partial [Phycisphaerae bacterium]|nr:Maf family protein [Phycisphaerae bacterium]
MRKKPEIILASASPRRAELLREAGIAFRTVVSESHEPARKPPGIPTGVWPMCLAYMKAHAVQRQLEGLQVTRGRGTAPAITILAADTIVVAGNGLREQILNTAADR